MYTEQHLRDNEKWALIYPLQVLKEKDRAKNVRFLRFLIKAGIIGAIIAGLPIYEPLRWIALGPVVLLVFWTTYMVLNFHFSPDQRIKRLSELSRHQQFVEAVDRFNSAMKHDMAKNEREALEKQFMPGLVNQWVELHCEAGLLTTADKLEEVIKGIGARDPTLLRVAESPPGEQRLLRPRM